ncbi:hypothetical protein [Actinoallomurus iriomotensis]|uniref:V-type ATPase subunit n=1 Tax=Actinoallomurus iriomotensis TaxID=478107 RepID=A0A9W6RKJ0_9ACTN|nr:hypothetical protein [Actinoallomurus iriomotensis]GLY75565.1 hypothetical protein Airi01_038320 [Actinoallomurus iriomotensis]
MTAAWVAGTTRARALARRCAGPDVARRVASSPALEGALARLDATPYRRGVRPGQSLVEAQHALLGTLLWQVRVLAGWLPGTGAAALRALAGWFEIANVDALMSGGPFFELGTMATAWSDLRNAPDLRRALAASPWGDPGGDDARSIQLRMRTQWARRVAAISPDTRPWAAGALALLVARERFAEERPVPEPPADLVGRRTVRAGDLAEFGRRLPDHAAWALQGVRHPADLWAAEARWWSRLERDGLALLSGARLDQGPVLGAVAVLAADARRVRAALELASRGGHPREAFDAVMA